MCVLALLKEHVGCIIFYLHNRGPNFLPAGRPLDRHY